MLWPSSHLQLNVWYSAHTVNCWEETAAQILVEILVLWHVIHLLPLISCHLFFQCLCSHLIFSQITSSKLQDTKYYTSTNKNQLRNKRQIWKCSFSMKLSCLVVPTLGLLEVTEQARKASLYVRSRTPKAFKPRTPSVSYPSAPFTRVEVSALAPEK